MDLEGRNTDEFDDFLSKVEQVGSILKDLSSCDGEISKRGSERADEYLSNIEKSQGSQKDGDGNTVIFSKTCLNKKALEGEKEEPDFPSMSAEDFMLAVEKDAKERYGKRKS